MIAAFEALRSEFRSAGAEGISLALVGFAILFFIAEKNRINENKNKLVKYEILCFLLIANPFGYTCINSFWMQNEYRKMFMILVPAVIVAAFVVELTSGYQHTWAKALCLTGCAGFVILSMYFLFTQPKIQVIENQYKVPDKVVELDSLLREENHDIKNMIAPREVCSWIREINESVQLLYGEDLINHMIQDDYTFEEEEENSEFQVIEIIEDYEYKYGFEYNDKCVVAEWMYRKNIKNMAATVLFWKNPMMIRKKCRRLDTHIMGRQMIIQYILENRK